MKEKRKQARLANSTPEKLSSKQKKKRRSKSGSVDSGDAQKNSKENQTTQGSPKLRQTSSKRKKRDTSSKRLKKKKLKQKHKQ